ncbi:MAG: hypothetical protein ACTSRZ_17250, partial [Promethearchaeota archaeon]
SIAKDIMGLGCPCRFDLQLAGRKYLEFSKDFGLKKCEFDQTKPSIINSDENSINNPSISYVDNDLGSYLRGNSKIMLNNQFQHQNHQHICRPPVNYFHLKIIKIIYILYSIMLFCNLLTIVYLNFELFSLEKIFGLNIKINGSLLIIFLLVIIAVLYLLNILLLVNKSLKSKRNAKQIEFDNENVNIYDVFAINKNFSGNYGAIIQMLDKKMKPFLDELIKKRTIPMNTAFIDPIKHNKIFPLYMALATYQKLENIMEENKVPINLIFLLRTIKEDVDVKKSLKQTKVVFDPPLKKLGLFNQIEKFNKEENESVVLELGEKLLGKYSIPKADTSKESSDEDETDEPPKKPDLKSKENQVLYYLRKLEKKNMETLSAILGSNSAELKIKTIIKEEKEVDLLSFLVDLDFSKVASILKGKKLECSLKPYENEIDAINTTYDDIPINEQLAIFIGLNIIDYMLEILDKPIPDKRKKYVFLPSSLKNHSFEVIKVKDEFKKSDWTKTNADYKSADFVVECKTRQPKKEDVTDGKLVRWLISKLDKAEKQVAISIQKSKNTDNEKNVGFVVSLYIPKTKLKSGDKGKSILYFVIEIITKPIPEGISK